MSSLVEAARFNWVFQADLCRMFLESHGVHAVLFDTQSSGYSEGAMTGVRVMVLEEDAEDAKAALLEYDG